MGVNFMLILIEIELGLFGSKVGWTGMGEVLC